MASRFILNPRIPYSDVIRRLRRVRWGKSTRLGDVSGYPFFVWRHSTFHPRANAILSAGIHGDEPAGVECLLALLEQRPEWLNAFNLAVFPCLNPWGYERAVRANQAGQDVNRQWMSAACREVRLVRTALRGWQYDLTICLHEDYEATGFYVYELSNGGVRLGREIVRAASRIIPTESRRRIEGRRAQSGVVLRSAASIRRRKHWPEALYYITYYSDHSLTVETPTHFPIEKRVRAHIEAIRVALASFSFQSAFKLR
ncbi:MAG: M14 family metallocarboxypeptidase [Verrucomicrobia bacterium]|nr:M14 family metallocarboxypeptidase [Verrucomicrobiota bacterium]